MDLRRTALLCEAAKTRASHSYQSLSPSAIFPSCQGKLGSWRIKPAVLWRPGHELGPSCNAKQLGCDFQMEVGMDAAAGMSVVVLILALLGLLIAVLWILMPFAIFGTKDLL